MEQPPAPKAEQNGAFWPRALVILLILIGIVLTTYFGFHLLRSAALLHRTPLRPGATDVALIRGWMTIPYLSRAYRVPESTLWSGLNIPALGNRHKNLRTLDREYGGGQPGAVTNKIKVLIHDYQAGHPSQPAPSRIPQYTPPIKAP